MRILERRDLLDVDRLAIQGQRALRLGPLIVETRSPGLLVEPEVERYGGGNYER
ncbi:MAG TPA: hypothetical protein VFQ24_04470 [Terriglobia bacterium]|nr:hypothetical protein [Terriglobia bacterium]